MNKKAANIIISLIILIPVAVYFTAWDYYAINIPKWDDHPLKGFIDTYAHANGWQAKIAALYKQHNEHRIALTRLISWLDYSIFGKLNYRHLMFAGNLLLVAIIPLWYIILKNNKKPFFALIPIPFLWLTLAQWENMYWGMASIQNFGVVTLALWTLYLCVNSKPLPYLLSILLLGLTVSTSPNGFFIIPIGVLLIFLSGNRQRLIAWILASSVAIFYYFSNYIRPESNPDSKASLIQLAKGYMAFLGSFAESFPVLDHFGVCIFIGTVLFLVAVSIASTTLFRITRNKYSAKAEKITDLFCLGTILFILGTALVVVYGRAGFGLEGLIASKYKIYSVLLLITAYLYIVIPIKGSFLSPYITAIIALAITFNIFSYHYHLVDAYNLRKYLTMSQFNWTFPDKTLQPAIDTTFAANVMEKTPVFYDAWPTLIKLADRQGYAGKMSDLPSLYKNTTFGNDQSGFHLVNSTFSSQRLQDSGIYFILSSDKRFFAFPANRDRNKNRKQLFLKQHYFAAGYHADVPYSEVAPGDYKLGILRQNGQDIDVFFGEKKVHIPKTEANKIKVNW